MAMKAKPRTNATTKRRSAGRAEASRRRPPAKHAVKPVAKAQPAKVAPVVEAPKPPVNPGVAAFNRAMKSLSALADFERLRIVRYNSQNFDLDRMRSLLKKIGNPHEQFLSIHIAGTKGKGSTCAMIAAMLQANGYKVGLYTSPHLVDIRERMTINGEMISHVMLNPSWASRPSMRSESTRFLGQPKETNATDLMGLVRLANAQLHKAKGEDDTEVTTNWTDKGSREICRFRLSGQERVSWSPLST